MKIRVDPLTDEDAGAVLDFEKENRAYFEKMVPSRGDDYYNFERYMIHHEKLLEEQRQELSHFYLIRSTSGEILGRINFLDIDRTQNSGHIGYRVGANHTGQGVAQQALQILLDHLREKGFTMVFAKTTNHNIASQKVLEKSGFMKVEDRGEAFIMNGESLRFIHYVWQWKTSNWCV